MKDRDTIPIKINPKEVRPLAKELEEKLNDLLNEYSDKLPYGRDKMFLIIQQVFQAKSGLSVRVCYMDPEVQLVNDEGENIL